MEKYDVYVNKEGAVILKTGQFVTTLTMGEARDLGNTLLDRSIEAAEISEYQQLSPEMKYVMQVCQTKNKGRAEKIVKIAKERMELSGLAFEEEVFGITEDDLRDSE